MHRTSAGLMWCDSKSRTLPAPAASSGELLVLVAVAHVLQACTAHVRARMAACALLGMLVLMSTQADVDTMLVGDTGNFCKPWHKCPGPTAQF